MLLIGGMGSDLPNGRQISTCNKGQVLCSSWQQAMVKLPLVKKKEAHIDEFVCLESNRIF